MYASSSIYPGSTYLYVHVPAYACICICVCLCMGACIIYLNSLSTPLFCSEQRDCHLKDCCYFIYYYILMIGNCTHKSHDYMY